MTMALLPAARRAAAALDGRGERVSRHALATALRAEGHAISNARASALLRMLKAESADGAESVPPYGAFRPRPRATPPMSAAG
jgi:hypothetical protein